MKAHSQKAIVMLNSKRGENKAVPKISILSFCSHAVQTAIQAEHNFLGNLLSLQPP